MSKLSIMLAGLCGNTAAALVASSYEEAGADHIPPCTTSQGPLAGLDLISLKDLRFCGWDYREDDLASTIATYGDLPPLSSATQRKLRAVRPRPGLRTALDIPEEKDCLNSFSPSDLGDALDQLQTDILSERQLAGADTSVVIYLGSPHSTKLNSTFRNAALRPVTWHEAADSYPVLPASLVYGLAAVRTGSHFVDFTPGVALESPLLCKAAEDVGVQLAGRDGSTGQTYLKHWLAEALLVRGIIVKGWYSTNVIGNHDGYVLSMSDHAAVKLADKRDGLEAILGYRVPDHHVSIDYVPGWGDRKESWDAISAEGWLGSKIELRVNWRGTDSLLAVPILIDIIRLIEYGARYGLAGFRPELGFFFKRPLGREGCPPSSLYTEMVSSYTRLGSSVE
jgi:myo-inositol-1-phosphate synthase